jgi:hypothetical protein
MHASDGLTSASRYGLWIDVGGAPRRGQIHKARNIMERLPKEHHATTRRVLRQAWELDDADKAEKLICNLARRLDQQWPGVAASTLEGLDEILTVVRLKLPKELRRSLACTNIAGNMMGTVRRVTRNVTPDCARACRAQAAGPCPVRQVRPAPAAQSSERRLPG